MDFGLGLTPIDDHDRAWLDANCVAFPDACCAAGDLPREYHAPLTKKNQRQTNTCAGHAFSTGREQLNWELTGTIEVYSALAAYLLAKRVYDGTTNDNGTSISSLFDAAARSGTPREQSCPFAGHVNPHALTAAAIGEANDHKIGQFTRLKGYDAVWRFKSSGQGFIVIGTPWYEGQTVNVLGTHRETLAAMRGRLLGFHARVVTGWYAETDSAGRPDLEVWNSHGDGPRPVAAECFDAWADDPRIEIIGCSEQREFAPRSPVDWSTTACLV